MKIIMRTSEVTRAVGLAVAAVVVVLGLAAPAAAQIPVGRAIPGNPIGTSAIRARFVFAMGDRIIVINEARELYYHELAGNQVGPATRMRGSTVGYGDEVPRAVVPRGRSIYVVSQRGELYRQDLRRDTVSAPVPIPGTPIGTGGQESAFMFFIGNRLVNATVNGEIFAYPIRRTVLPAQRIGTYRITGTGTSIQPRFAFPLGGRQIYIVFDNGQIVRHDINPNLGRAVPIATRSQILGRQTCRWVFPNVRARRLYAVDDSGMLYVHDLSRLIPRAEAEAAE
jgi:hypothetical protein